MCTPETLGLVPLICCCVGLFSQKKSDAQLREHLFRFSSYRCSFGLRPEFQNCLVLNPANFDIRIVGKLLCSQVGISRRFLKHFRLDLIQSGKIKPWCIVFDVQPLSNQAV